MSAEPIAVLAPPAAPSEEPPTSRTLSCSGEPNGIGWPMPSPPSLGLPHPQSYDVSKADVVRDRVTGLLWQRRLDPKGYAWSAAHSYCQNLQLAGYRDWRVPTLAELMSIADPSRVRPAIDPVAFPDTPSLPFWASQTLDYNGGLAWYVFFENGGAYAGNDVSDEQRVRCVRGGNPPPAACYELTETTVRDLRTGLEWERRADAPAVSFPSAKERCATLRSSGAPFRLPTVKELITIVDLIRSEPATDLRAFPGTPSELFWSSSEAPSSNKIWGVNFASGASGLASRDFAARTRCVR